MANSVACNVCGRNVLEYTLSDGKCWSCTKSESNVTDVSTQEAGVVGDSSQKAINVLRTFNSINLTCGLILAFAIFLYFVETFDNPSAGLLFAAIVVLLSCVGWAMGRVFVGIAEDIKGIRKNLEKD
jgi:hypothetical protein